MDNMSAGEPTGVDEAGRLYAAAYAAHYAAGNLREAFELYRSLVTTHPASAEAGYCQAQILNIVNAVVPTVKGPDGKFVTRLKDGRKYLADWNTDPWDSPFEQRMTPGDLKKAQDIYGNIIDQCTSCHARVDPFVKRKFADISFDLGQHTTPVLEMYLSLAQEDSRNVPFYYQRVSEIYSSQGNEEEARRFQGFVHQTQEGKGRV